MSYLQSLEKDLAEWYLIPENEKAFSKIKCKLIAGKEIRWYYKEDLDWWNQWKDENEDPVKAGFNAGGGYYGIIIPKPDSDPRGELDSGDCVVVITNYPCEKCNPEVDWITLHRLLNNEDLVEIID